MKLVSMIRDNFVFLREFVTEFQSTGTICPTSRWAAEALTLPLRDHNPSLPRHILELGPGTGSVTVKIIEQLRPGDKLSICEINPRFLKILKHKLQKNRIFREQSEHITFHGCAVQDLPENEKYDIIVCALPFLNFDIETVREIFSKLQRISQDDAVMTYYEYIGLRSMGLMVSPAQRRARIKKLDNFFDQLLQKHLSDKQKIWLNLPPINIYTLENCNNFTL